MPNSNSIPVVMCFSGLDSTGGAGIQADIEAIISMGAHPAPIVTALTVQDTTHLSRYQATDPLLTMEQARAVLEDMPVHAIKIGMLGSIEQIEMLNVLLQDYPDIPVVLDPVLSAGGGGQLLESGAETLLTELLLPQTTIFTPNSTEARILAPEADTLDACAQEIMSHDCDYVLITGAHEKTEHVENRLYSNRRLMEVFSWDRLSHSYHGSGCTLAASIAALLANGMEPFTAINEAQEYTWQTLEHANRIGMGQLIPNRLYWAREAAEDE